MRMLETDDPQIDSTAQTIRHAIRFLRVLWHRRLVVVGSLVVCGMLGGLYYATAPRIFEADGQVLVVDTTREAMSTSLTMGTDVASMATYEKLVVSPLVLQAAARQLDGPTRAVFGSQDPELVATQIATSLKAKGLRQTNLLELKFRAPDATVAATVTAAIIKSYADFMQESHRGTAGTLVDTLTREKQQVDAKLEGKQQEFLAIRKRVGDLGIKADGKVMHPLVERAIQLNAALIDTQKKRLFLQASYQSLATAMKQGHNIRQSLLAIEETLGKEVFLDSMGLGQRDKETRVVLEKQLLEDRAQLDTLLQYYGDNHPKVIERRKKIEQVEGYLAQFDTLGSMRTFGGDDAKLAATVAQILKQRLDAATQHERWLQQSFEEAKQDSIGLTSDMSQLDLVDHDIKWLRELRNTLLNQIASIDLRQDNGGVRTTVVREPVVAEKPVSPKLALTVLAVLVGGLGIGVAITFVIDVLDDRMRTPEDLQAELGLPLLATIGSMEA
ncbi:MAG: GumC family protein, partial [Planctomycetia bacterium]